MLLDYLIACKNKLTSHLALCTVFAVLMMKLLAVAMWFFIGEYDDHAKIIAPQNTLNYQLVEFDFHSPAPLRASVNKSQPEASYNTIYQRKTRNPIITRKSKKNTLAIRGLRANNKKSSKLTLLSVRNALTKRDQKIKRQPIKNVSQTINRLNEKNCLATAIYFEARSEPLQGQWGVAEVILNRVKSKYYPDTICKVVFEGEQKPYRCQFSFACDGISDRPNKSKAWQKASHIARLAVFGKKHLNDLSNATHYHADYVRPYWASRLKYVKQIGRHIFYSTQKRS